MSSTVIRSFSPPEDRYVVYVQLRTLSSEGRSSKADAQSPDGSNYFAHLLLVKPTRPQRTFSTCKAMNRSWQLVYHNATGCSSYAAREIPQDRKVRGSRIVPRFAFQSAIVPLESLLDDTADNIVFRCYHREPCQSRSTRNAGLAEQQPQTQTRDKDRVPSTNLQGLRLDDSGRRPGLVRWWAIGWSTDPWSVDHTCWDCGLRWGKEGRGSTEGREADYRGLVERQGERLKIQGCSR